MNEKRSARILGNWLMTLAQFFSGLCVGFAFGSNINVVYATGCAALFFTVFALSIAILNNR